MRRIDNVGLLSLTLLMVLGACEGTKKGGDGTGGAGGGPTGGAGAGPTGGVGGGPTGGVGGGPTGGAGGGPTGGVGGGPTGGAGGGPTGGAGGGPGNLLCTDLLNRMGPLGPGTPARCCPRPPPDCHDKPDGFTEPGEEGLCVDAEPGGSSYCSCECSRGQWWCGC